MLSVRVSCWFRIMLVLGCCLGCLTPSWAVVRIGMTPEQVEAELGSPNGQRQSGDEMLWVYGSGARLNFEDGLLVRVSGIDYVSGQGEKPGEKWLTPETVPETQSGVRFSDGRTVTTEPQSGVRFSDGRTAATDGRTGAYFERDEPAKTVAPSAAKKATTAGAEFQISPELLEPTPGLQNSQTRLLNAMGSYEPVPGESPWTASWAEVADYYWPTPPAEDPLALMPTEDEADFTPTEAGAEETAGSENFVDDLAREGGFDPDAVRLLSGDTSQLHIPGMDPDEEQAVEMPQLGGFVWVVKYLYSAFISFVLIWVLIKVFNEEMFLTSMLFFAAIDAAILVAVGAIMKSWGFPGALTVDYMIAVIVMAILLPHLSCVKDQVQSLKIVCIHKVLQYGVGWVLTAIVFFWALSLFTGSCQS